MGDRRRYFKVADSIAHEQWSNDDLAMVIRLMAHLHERWARDDLTAEQATHCELGPTQQQHVSGKRRADVARKSLERLAHLASMSIEHRGDVAVIIWPKFSIFQGLPSRYGTSVDPQPPSPNPHPKTQPQEEKNPAHKDAPVIRTSPGSSHSKPSALKTNQQPGAACLVSFEAWWRLYPLKTAKRDAEKAWLKLAPSPAQVTMLMEAVQQQLQWPIELRYRPYPATWLRGERWLDETPVGSSSNGSGLPYRRSTSAADSTTDAIVAAARSADARRPPKVMPALEVLPVMTIEPPKMVETEEGDYDDF